MTAENFARQKFLEDYRYIRHAEHRGSDKSGYYRTLPSCEQSDPNAAMWAMRAKTYSYFVKNVLEARERRGNNPLDVLDLGAGNCWLSNRLTIRGHRAVAVDIFADERDGLRVARHYANPFPVIETDFDHLPLPAHSFDLAIFNASFHYSVDYFRTLSEVRRCLRPSGSFVILDTPIYRLGDHGKRMVEEKHAAFAERYGFPSDALPSIEFLDIPTLQTLHDTLDIDWQIVKPWYGWRWHLRPLNAFLRRRRPPSKFWMLVGKFQAL
ncbi:MAG TPA: class I SAM-dependent methyltransferase [Bryobacteraceae bacterium]|nr:class I SAM-dependent methyltransferase [Bryobacteraceae bacterium]